MEYQIVLDYWKRLVNAGDIRSEHLPFTREPKTVIYAVVVYLVMVIAGPRFMEKRKPLQLRKVLIGYNVYSVVFSIWLMMEFVYCSFCNPNFDLFCQDPDEKDISPMAMRLVNAHWWYYFSKYVEFLDTFFFVMRKKNNQISFLHVYHHVSMLILQWCVVKFVPGGVSYLGPLLNCFVHSLMYMYYMLSAFGPHMQKYLWWKKYLTRIQIIQFIIAMLHVSVAIYCTDTFPKFWMWSMLVYMITLFMLFINYYKKSYREKSKYT